MLLGPLVTARKRSLGQGNIFTGMSVCPWGVSLSRGRGLCQGGVSVREVSVQGASVRETPVR